MPGTLVALRIKLDTRGHVPQVQTPRLARLPLSFSRCLGQWLQVGVERHREAEREGRTNHTEDRAEGVPRMEPFPPLPKSRIVLCRGRNTGGHYLPSMLSAAAPKCKECGGRRASS